jgi:hypothetical protein
LEKFDILKVVFFVGPSQQSEQAKRKRTKRKPTKRSEQSEQAKRTNKPKALKMDYCNFSVLSEDDRTLERELDLDLYASRVEVQKTNYCNYSVCSEDELDLDLYAPYAMNTRVPDPLEKIIESREDAIQKKRECQMSMLSLYARLIDEAKAKKDHGSLISYTGYYLTFVKNDCMDILADNQLLRWELATRCNDFIASSNSSAWLIQICEEFLTAIGVKHMSIRCEHCNNIASSDQRIRHYVAYHTAQNNLIY